jgi:type III pantothenate kinase
MKLLIDAGNTRLKWQLHEQGRIVQEGACLFDSIEWPEELVCYASRVSRIAVSTVASEAGRDRLVESLGKISGAPVTFYWPEAMRGGLINSYADFSKMGADRWHAMYGAWSQKRAGFAVIDAGSAITVDYVANDGLHLGGYILPGKQMM